MDTRPTALISISTRHRKDLGDIDALCRSIQDVGLLQPLVILGDGRLVAGERRLEAVKQLGWREVPVVVVAGLEEAGQLLRAERDENTCRKDFTPSEAVAIGQSLEEVEREAARERRRAAGIANLPTVSSGKFPELIGTGQTRDHVGATVGMSGRTYERAKTVVNAAEEEPEKYAPLVEEMDRTGRVNGAYKKLVTQRQAEAIRAGPPPLPDGPFRVLAVDPPWPYNNRATDPSHRASNPYPSMSIEEIKALPVGDLADDDAVLWLWTTNAHLRVAFEVLDAWGFQYKTTLTWTKNKMGLGDWLRGKTEHCLMAVRGRPVITLTNQTTALQAPARSHSQKPEEFYALVESLCPGSKLELFAREHRGGWGVHGDQTTLFRTPGFQGSMEL